MTFPHPPFRNILVSSRTSIWQYVCLFMRVGKSAKYNTLILCICVILKMIDLAKQGDEATIYTWINVS